MFRMFEINAFGDFKAIQNLLQYSCVISKDLVSKVLIRKIQSVIRVLLLGFNIFHG
jgi:hypothetical protein